MSLRDIALEWHVPIGADEMYQFKMLSQPFQVSTMLGGL
jgi:hypothetical protein